MSDIDWTSPWTISRSLPAAYDAMTWDAKMTCILLLQGCYTSPQSGGNFVPLCRSGDLSSAVMAAVFERVSSEDTRIFVRGLDRLVRSGVFEDGVCDGERVLFFRGWRQGRVDA